MNLRYKITAAVCLFCAFVFAVLAAAAPVYTHKVNNTGTLPDYDGVSDVIVGSEGFLFRAKSDKTDEYGDFTGKTFYTETALENTVAAMTDAAEKLKNENCEALFVFIPSKMAVYEDKLPDNVKSKKAAWNKFSALKKAVYEKGLLTLDLTEVFSDLKDENLLFHTCADKLNDVGGFYLYNAVRDKLDSAFGFNMKKAALTDYTVVYSTDNNYPLTREYRNETGITVSNKTYTFEEKQTAYEKAEFAFDSTAATRLPETARDGDCVYPSLLVLDTGAAEASRKFFSSACSLCVYTTRTEADGAVIQTARPDAAVFLIYESELYRLPVSQMPPDENKEQTAEPVIKASAFSDADKYVIFGSCEKNCTVTVYGGDGVCSAYSEDGDFCVEVTVSDFITGLSVCAKGDGKAESGAVTVTAEYDGSGYKQVVIGLDGHLHYAETLPDYLGTNMMSQDTVEGYIGYMKAKAERIHAVSPDTEIIYVIAPNHLTIYPETAPEWLRNEKISDGSKLDQLLSAFAGVDYVKFIDLKTPLLEAKKTAPYRIYNKTDTHWNELGAYYAYREIMGYIAERFPDASPDPLDMFDVYTEDVAGGDMVNFLGIDLESVKEHGVYVRAKNGLQSGIVKDHSMNFANAWFSEMHEFHVEGKMLPTMIMYRDSFSTNLMSFLAEKFSYSRFHTMWDYPEEIDLYAELQPDYIIMEYVERGLGGLS